MVKSNKPIINEIDEKLIDLSDKLDQESEAIKQLKDTLIRIEKALDKSFDKIEDNLDAILGNLIIKEMRMNEVHGKDGPQNHGSGEEARKSS